MKRVFDHQYALHSDEYISMARLNFVKNGRLHPMRYLMKQKLLSIGDDFTIKDADGNDRFYIDGKAFSLGDKLSFQDMKGNELALIRQKMLALKKNVSNLSRLRPLRLGERKLAAILQLPVHSRCW